MFFIVFTKITFYWKLFSDCCDQFGYPGSIVYLSCSLIKQSTNRGNTKSMELTHLSKEYLVQIDRTQWDKVLYGTKNGIVTFGIER